MMKEPQALFLPLKETGTKPLPQNRLVAYLPGVSKDQSDKNVDEEGGIEVLSLMDRPFECAAEQVPERQLSLFACSRCSRFILQEAKVDHDGPESSKDHDEEEREVQVAEDEGESHEEAKEEQEPSSFPAVLEEIKAYGMLLARETQVHVFSAISSLWPMAAIFSHLPDHHTETLAQHRY